ncbi:uncharacterized protein DUF1153 [Rhodovulum imhoffii]|uniref:Uncharacterized protein DUF1153 n=1 Tax=Rhodovulum imhoffii TaxID=365340 RepID=A0A2T5BTL2_9RHOB|nr:DUF1153 domain-containing protein [Rhodovulum imhoffii]MBK5934157.1 hypothetical protein [Rhodovulum imhoffii]PTN02768.1 uncharacterized protein DUF1153 [Rhodovulum imhoffii]
MYIKRTDGPRTVTLPDGSHLSLGDLPAADTTRWVARRKAVVANAVQHGLIAAQEARSLYNLSEEELEGWIRALNVEGLKGLKVTKRNTK